MRTNPLSAALSAFLVTLPQGKEAAAAHFEGLLPPQRSAILEEAESSGLGLLVSEAAQLPPTPMRRTEVRIQQFRALRHKSQTIRLARAIAESGIPVMAVKGAPLAEHLYHSDVLQPWMRPLGDIDLFVPPEAIFDAAQVICREGLEPDAETARRFFSGPKSGRGAVRHHLVFEMPKGTPDHSAFALELHAHLGHSPFLENLEFADLYANAVIWEAAQSPSGKSAAETPSASPANAPRLLSEADEAVYLASHGAGHRFLHPKWILDLAIALSRVDTHSHWPLLWQRAEGMRCKSALELSLLVLSGIGLQLPHAPELAAFRSKEMRLALRRRAFEAACALEKTSPFLRGILTRLALLDSLSMRQIPQLADLTLHKIIRR